MLNLVWIFSDSIKGHEIQSLALAHKLAQRISLFHCTIRQPWLSFAPKILPRFGRNIIWEKQPPDTSQVPDVIITCGRSMAAIGKYYTKQLGCKHVQILNPGDNPKRYDILICPEHDDITGKNIITSKGSLHNINQASLAKIKCSDPIDIVIDTVAVFIGNPDKDFFQELDNVNAKIKKYFPQHEIIVCGSRRTAKKYHENIRYNFKQAKQIWLADTDGKNPYMQLLACSKIFIVTADSINMVSEACATDKPVIAIAQQSISPKHKRFITSIAERLTDFTDTQDKYIPLQTLSSVVDKSKKLLEVPYPRSLSENKKENRA